jgi:hypothetical protein
VVKFDYLGVVSPLGTVSLPSTLALVEPDDPTTQIGIRIIGFNGQTARVLRDIQTTVPHQRTGLLRVPLDFIDTNSVGTGTTTIPDKYYPGGPDMVAEGLSQFDPDTIPSACDPMQLCQLGGNCMTTINGACATAVVQSSTLPDYEDSLVFGTNGSSSNENCFNVQSCFAEASPVSNVTFSGTSTAPGACTFPLPTSGGSVATDGGIAAERDGSADAAADTSEPNAATDAATPTGSSGGSSGAPVIDSGESVGGANCGTETCTGTAVCCAIKTQEVCMSEQACVQAQQSLNTGGDAGAAPSDAAVQTLEVTLAAMVDAAVSAEAPSDSGMATGTDMSSGGSTASGSNSAASATLNFAIVTTQGAGACNTAGQCFVPIENDQTEGWSVSGNTVTLAAGLCGQLMSGSAQLYVVNGPCSTKTDSQPVCEAAQLDGGSPSGEDASGVATADGGGSGTGVGGGAHDSGANANTPDGGSFTGGSSGGGTMSGAPADAGSGSFGAPDATVADSSTPGVLTGVSGLAAGPYSTCASLTSGNGVCWGYVLGTTTGTPEPVAGLANITDGTIGGAQATTQFYCVIQDIQGTSEALCEGSNGSGQLGNGSMTDSDSPKIVVGVTNPQTIAAGAAFACAIDQNGTVYCWGDDTYGQLGNGDSGETVPLPSPVANLPSATRLALGSDFACALVQGGYVYCWGDNATGVLGGQEAGTYAPVPVLVSGFGEQVLSDITAGQGHVCALSESGAVLCWGDNTYDQLGPAAISLPSSDTPVTALGAGVTSISAGGDETCVIRTGGQVACWGADSEGQLGPEGPTDQTPSANPVVVPISNALGVSVGGEHVCALLQDTTLECWGFDGSGQLGNGTTTGPLLTPGLVVAAGTATLGADGGGEATP